MRNPFLVLVLAGFFASGAAVAQTQIYTCKDADGGIEYSQLPCREQEPDEAKEQPAVEQRTEDDASEAPTVELASPESPRDEPEPTADEAACKKRYRDAIDAIDAEIMAEYSAEKAGEYKQRLLVLTRKLRACGSG